MIILGVRGIQGYRGLTLFKRIGFRSNSFFPRDMDSGVIRENGTLLWNLDILA